MCALGQHDETYQQPSARVKRRRAETGSVIGPARAPKPRPPSRGVIKTRRAALHADLEATKAPDFVPDAEFNPEQMELLPRDQQQLPDHLVTTPDDGVYRYWVGRD